MEDKYKRAALSGVFGLVILFVLFITMVFLMTPLTVSESQGADTGPAAVGAAIIFIIASLLSMLFVGSFSVWWTFKKYKRAFTLREAMEVSAIAGAVTTLALCLMIFIFQILTSLYGPTPSFSISRFLSTLNSGLTVCCFLTFVIGIMMSVIGGLVYSVAIFLIRKD